MYRELDVMFKLSARPWLTTYGWTLWSWGKMEKDDMPRSGSLPSEICTQGSYASKGSRSLAPLLAEVGPPLGRGN